MTVITQIALTRPQVEFGPSHAPNTWDRHYCKNSSRKSVLIKLTEINCDSFSVPMTLKRGRKSNGKRKVVDHRFLM